MYYSACLAHHGILGQKWGKRNGPPYPLNPEDHSKAERKAGWRKSLDNYKEYSKVKKKENASAIKRYYEETASKPEYIAKKHLREEQERIRQSLKERYPEQAKNDELVRKIAMGVGIAAIVGATAYVGVQAASYANAIGVQADVTSKLLDGKHRAASVISSLMDRDITLSQLSDRDEVITAGTTLQRVIRDYGDSEKALSMEKAKDFIYATFDKNDNDIYSTLFNARGTGKKLITSREVLNDLKMPSAFKRANTFKEMLNDSSFVSALESDLKRMGVLKTLPNGWQLKLRDYSDGQLFDLFNSVAGNSESKSPSLYFKRIAEMGYNAIRDDNDSGYLGKSPVILLNASKDTVVRGKKTASDLTEMMSRLRLKKIPEFDRSLIRR